MITTTYHKKQCTKMTELYKVSDKSYESSYFEETPYLEKLLSIVVPISTSKECNKCQKVASSVWYNCNF